MKTYVLDEGIVKKCVTNGQLLLIDRPRFIPQSVQDADYVFHNVQEMQLL
ncbi:hypothetical protein ES703_95451 [subsurface metagenome]